MKFIYILTFFTSCSFYSETYLANIPIVANGKVIISSNSVYREISVFSDDIKIQLNKYEIIYISYYSYFGDSLTRFPVGCILKEGEKNIFFNANLGILTKCVNDIHALKGIVDNYNIEAIEELFLQVWDPWIYNQNDIKQYLLGNISINSVTSSRIFEIPALNYLYSWNYENPCFLKWYPSIQTFINEENEIVYRLEILNNGTYNGFIIP